MGSRLAASQPEHRVSQAMAMAQVAPGGQLLVCAGQVGRRPDGSFPAGAAEQCRLAFAACADILEAAGLGWSDVVLRTAWLTAGCDAADYAAVVATVAEDGVPASVAVGVEMPGEVLVEVEVIAAKVGAASPARSVLKWDPPGVTPSSAYWHAATVPGDARLLFASGQIGVRPDGSIADSAPEQAELTYSNLDTLLRDAGWDGLGRCRQAHNIPCAWLEPRAARDAGGRSGDGW